MPASENINSSLDITLPMLGLACLQWPPILRLMEHSTRRIDVLGKEDTCTVGKHNGLRMDF